MAGECAERQDGMELQITVRTREGEIIHTNERILCVIGDRQRRNSSVKQRNKMDCVPRCPPPPSLKWGSFASGAFKPRYGNDPKYYAQLFSAIS